MRITLGVAGLIACIGLQPALAFGGGTLSGGNGVDSDVHGIIGGGAQRGTEVAPDFRIRADLGAGAHRANLLGDDHQPRLGRRFASSMIDYFPFGDGFHLSMGGRKDKQSKAARQADTMASLLYAPQSQLNSNCSGFKRYAPAATMGYSSRLGNDISFGIEGGAMLQRGDPATQALAASYRLGSRDDRFAKNSRANPMVQASFAYRF